MASSKAPTNKDINRIALLALGLIGIFYIPWMPNHFTGADVDSSWIMTLHHGFANGWHWGSDILWHYGPLGFLFGKYYHPDTYGLSLILHAFLGLGIMGISFGIWRKNPTNPMIPLAIAAILILTDDVVFYLSPTLLLLNYFLLRHTLKHRQTWLLIALCIIASLTKFSYLLMCVCALLAIEAHRFTNRKLPLIHLGSFILIWLVVWVLCGQSGQDISLYLRAAFELGSGFTAMASYQQPYYFALAFMVLSAGWVLLQTSTATKTLPESSLFFLLALIGLVIAITKAAFIHDNDHHIIQALGWLFCYCLITKDWFWEQCAKRHTYSFSIIALLCLGAFSLPYFDKASDDASKLADVFRQLSNNQDTQEDDTSLSKLERYQLTMHNLYKQRPFPNLVGTADIFRNHQAYLLAHPHKELRYTPRPVFQSYHAYTPWLAAQNQRFFTSTDAPDHVLVDLDTVMQRHPALSDPLALLALWEQYEAKQVTAGYVHLQKRTALITVNKHNLSSKTITWDQPVSIPNQPRDMLWASIEFKPTWIGRMLGFLLYPPPIQLHTTLQSGYQINSRITANTAKTGFIISPYLDNALQFAALYSIKRPEVIRANHIRELSIHSNWQTRWRQWFYHDDIILNLSRITSSYPAPSLELTANENQILQLSLGLPEQTSQHSNHLTAKHLQIKPHKDGLILSTYNHARMHMPLNAILPRSISLEVTAYDAYNHSVKNGSLCDIKITGHENNAESITLWQDQLDNRAGSENRSASISLDVNGLPVDTLELSITPQDDNTDNWVYWRIQNLDQDATP